MRKTALTLALAITLPSAPLAQAYAEIHLQLPEILPPLVVIQPGVQVVPELQQEVFLVDGAYYARHDGGWYRAPDVRARAWAPVPVRAVPVALVKIPPGKYKGWKPSKAEKAAAKAEKKEEKAERKAWKKHGKH